MAEERVLAADWLVRLRAVASRSERERLAEARLMLLQKRRRSPRQGRLMQEEESETMQDLLVDTQEEDEGARGLLLAPEGRGAVNFAGFS